MRKHDHSLASNAAALIICGLLAGLVVAAAAFPAIAMTGLAAKAGAEGFDNLPSVLQVPQAPQITNVYASDGKTLITSLFDEDRRDVTIDQIAPVMLQAIVASEDTRFYDHHGVDIRGVARALVQNQSGGQQGASTLTMQYVRQATSYSATTPQQVLDATVDTPARKIREMHLAIAVEEQLTKQFNGDEHAAKQEILRRYLNIAPFGHRAYGIYAASETYFHVTPSELTLDQAAMLAGMVQSPSRDDPTTKLGASLALDRRNTHVLAGMLKAGDITQAAYDDAISKPLGLNLNEPANGCISSINIKWGFFCDYLERWWLTQPAFGADEFTRESQLETGGYKIVTTLNVQDQAAADKYVKKYATKGNTHGGQDAMMLAGVEPGTGEVTLMAVNRTYSNDDSHNGVSTNKEKRAAGIRGTYPNTTLPLVSGDGSNTDGFQFGSSFKMFTMIAALQDGLPLSYTVNTEYKYTSNDPSSDPKACNGLYCPHNSAASEHGVRNMWTGFGQSVNTYFVPLEDRMNDGTSSGAIKAFNVAKSLGIGFAPGYQSSVGDSFTLGTSPSNPLEMAAAYAAVDDSGMYCAPIPVRSITNNQGEKLDVAQPQCHQAIDPDIAHAAVNAARCPIGDEVPDCGHYATAGNTRGVMGDRPVAGKTGTNDNGESHALIAMTPQLAVAGILTDPDYAHPDGGYTVSTNVNAAVAHTLADSTKGLPKLGWPNPPSDLANGTGHVRIPGFKCASVGSAEAQLRGSGLRYIVMRAPVDSAANCPGGSVERSDPSGSTTSHAVVALYLSNGKSKAPTPNPSGSPPAGPGGQGGGPGGQGGGPGGTGNGNGILPCLPAIDCSPPKQ